MAAPAFPKFSFGGGPLPPQPGPLHAPEADPGASGASAAVSAAPTPPSKPDTVEAVIAMAMVPEDLIKELMAALKADDSTKLEHLACVPDEDFTAAAAAIQIGGVPISAIQKGQVGYFVKVLRQVVAGPGPQPPGPPPALPAPAPPPTEGAKRKVSEVLDQVDDSVYPELAPEAIAHMREFHRSVTGGDPPDHERPTAEQLSALTHRIRSGKAPYTDFAVFGPYGRRQSKLLRFTAQVFVHGELVTRQLRGPGSHQGWRASWGVFRAAMIMVNGASPSTLDRYARGIEELVSLFPNAWGIISLADETMRAERWDIIKEGMDAGTTWEEVIAGSAFGFDNRCAHWWYLHVVGPLTSGARQSAASAVAVLEGLVPGGASQAPPPAHTGPGGRQTQNLMTATAKKKARLQRSSSTPCEGFNQGGCNVNGCRDPHVCSGCGGKYAFAKCWTCNPGMKGAGKAAPSSSGAGMKKKKGGKGGSTARRSK